MVFENKLLSVLDRIAKALEDRNFSTADHQNTATGLPDNDSSKMFENTIFRSADAFIWDPKNNQFTAVSKVNRIPLELLQGIQPMQELLLKNTLHFAQNLPANNALLWGARGMGKSSLVKAIHAYVNETLAKTNDAFIPLKLIEIHREDLPTLPICLSYLRAVPNQFILFCDDLSFDTNDTTYKSLKAVLEGGLEGRPHNVIFYATSNRRHLMPRQMIENERATAINPSESVEEKVSLSDRFGLWIGFHNCSQDDYLKMVDCYAQYFGLQQTDDFEAKALEWAMTRGARSGRVAWQFIQATAGEQGKTLNF